jgi:predicted nucleic acid-binding protein
MRPGPSGSRAAPGLPIQPGNDHLRRRPPIGLSASTCRLDVDAGDSSVVAAELLGGARSARDRKTLEDRVLGPFMRRDRMLTPGAAAWEALGRTLAALREREGLQLPQLPRSFTFDILLAWSCREHGVVLVSGNTRDMARIRRVFTFEYVSPYPAAA